MRDKQDIQFKRDSEARIVAQGGHLVIEAFYPMNLLGKLSLQQENVEDWRELVESVMIDWNYDGAVFQPLQVDIPGKNDLVTRTYPIPADAGTIRIKITDLLSESLSLDIEGVPGESTIRICVPMFTAIWRHNACGAAITGEKYAGLPRHCALFHRPGL